MTERITENLMAAAEILKCGGLVAVPTETVYGLAGNGLDPAVIEHLYEVKGRPAVKPISLMVPDASAISAVCEDIPSQARVLAARFWPGPLTLVLRAKDLVPSILRAGGETVGLRCPRQEQTLRLLQMLDFPLAVPSANPSGAESPKNAEQVLEYFDGRIEAVVDGGPCDLGRESTLLDMSGTPYRILRQGALPETEIVDALVDAMTVVGITGGSGSGKTTALHELEKRGALVLDCDAVYHELLAENRSLIDELALAFPSAVTDGCVNRNVLGGIVFQDADALHRLNSITHRYIDLEIRRRLCDWAMKGGTLAALDAVELISSGVAALCDFTVAVTASMETRIARIMARDGISREKAELRLRAQRSDDYFIEHCDVTLRNDDSRSLFIRQLNQVLEEKLSNGKPERTAFF